MELKNITIDDINTLKLQGRYSEAKALLKAFVSAGRKNIKEGRRINKAIEDKIHKTKSFKNHKCVRCGKDNDNGKYHCEACLDAARQYKERCKK